MMKYINLLLFALITLMLSAGDTLGDAGSITITSPTSQPFKANGGFTIKGTYVMTADTIGPKDYCEGDGLGGVIDYEFRAGVYLSIDGGYPSSIGSVSVIKGCFPEYHGFIYDGLNRTLPFEHYILVNNLDPSILHTGRLYFSTSQEEFGAITFDIRICQDKDGDGFTDCDEEPSCKDTDKTMYPGAPEICDNIDNNCNGETDEGTGPCCKDPGLCQSCQDPQGIAGHPVSLMSGAETISRTDLTIGKTYPITIERRYNSLSTYDSQIGYGWALNYDKRLYTYPDGSVTVRKECGWKRQFMPAGGGFITPADDSGTLVQNADGSYTWTQLNGEKETYDARGRLISNP